MKIEQMVLAFFLLPLSRICNYPITLTTNDKTPQKINMNLDFGTAHTLITSSKLDCDALESCEWYSPDQKEETGTYNHEEYKYKNAYLTILFDTENDQDQKVAFKVYIRINNMFNIIGMNNINAITNNMQRSHEVVIDLKKSTLKIQPMKKSDGNIFSI